MAIRYAVADGNWSDVATWDGGASIPTHTDTVYANGKTVDIDQNLVTGAQSIVNAGSFVIGHAYVITTIGTTNFVAIGARSNTVGIVFIATGIGTGTGTAETTFTITNGSVTSPSILINGSYTISTPNINLDVNVIYLGSTTSWDLLKITSGSTHIINGAVVKNGTSTACSVCLDSTVNLTINGYVSHDQPTSSSTGQALEIDASSAGSTVTINGNLYTGLAAYTYCVHISSVDNITLNINGDIISEAKSVTSTNGVSAVGTCNNLNITIIGNLINNNLSTNTGYLLNLSFSGLCTVNITGDMTSYAASHTVYCTNSTCAVTIIGNLYSYSGGSPFYTTNCSSTIVTGNLTVDGGTGSCVYFSGTNGSLLITGDLRVKTGTNSGDVVTIGNTSGSQKIINGDIFSEVGTGIASTGLDINGGSNVTYTGNISLTGLGYGIRTNGASQQNVVINADLTPSGENGNVVLYVSHSNASVDSVTVNGNVIGGSGTGSFGIQAINIGGVTINGNITAGSGSGSHGMYMSSASNNVIINGDVVAFPTAHGVYNNVTAAASYIGFIRLNGSVSNASNGLQGIYAAVWSYAVEPSINHTTKVSIAESSLYTLYSSAYWATQYPIETDVRASTLYGAGDIYTGTLAVPPAATVSLGVPVDNTVGTLSSDPSGIAGAVRTELAVELARIDSTITSRSTLTAGQVRTELATELARIDIPISAATTDVSGIPLAVRTELAVELARIDAAISTRLATAGYTAPDSAATIATAVEAALLNEGDGQQLIDAILQVINTNLDLPALELTAIGNAVRLELATELARIDAAITSRSTLTAGQVRSELTTELARIDIPISAATTDVSGIPLAVRSELTTELARIDIPISAATTDVSGIPLAVRTELAAELGRVANCSTVETTGAQLAAVI